MLQLEEHLGPRLSHLDHMRAIISEEEIIRPREGMCFYVTVMLKALIREEVMDKQIYL